MTAAKFSSFIRARNAAIFSVTCIANPSVFQLCAYYTPIPRRRESLFSSFFMFRKLREIARFLWFTFSPIFLKIGISALWARPTSNRKEGIHHEYTPRSARARRCPRRQLHRRGKIAPSRRSPSRFGRSSSSSASPSSSGAPRPFRSRPPGRSTCSPRAAFCKSKRR